ncbi:MAG: hypothetical protein SF182_09160 [Deltaproteobacteria bacterium]|nr:hypothetical protein [Deltaproteobacteria bacterium]
MLIALVVLPLRLAAAPFPGVCGNGDLDVGEQCDSPEDSACPGHCDSGCQCPPVTTIDIPSAGKGAHTPGSPGVTVTNPKLLAQLGADADLNQARYTRYRLDAQALAPDAILILVPGFEGGAGNFQVLAQELLQRAHDDYDLRLEVWAFDRRTNQLEDTLGLDLAEDLHDAFLAQNWLFGTELSLPLDPRLSRRAVFYNPQDDVPFMADWTNLVFSQDIDAVVEAARAVAKHGNVFLGGHSAGTGFTARYAATDFNLGAGCAGTPQPGYAKLRGLVLLEGGGGSSAGADQISDETLDRAIARFDGGLFGAVRDNAPRCVDGTTACTVASELTDCAGQVPPRCTPPTTAYSGVPGILNPRVLAASEATAIQALEDLNTFQSVGQLDVGAPGNNAIAKVPDIASLGVVPPGTVMAGFGTFLNKNGPIAAALSFVAMSIGEPGPTVDGILFWKDFLHGPITPGPDRGPPPTALPAATWGRDTQATRIDRVIFSFFLGATNFSDWYYPQAGPSTTAGIGLDSTKLSAPPPLGRGRCDIENLTQAAHVDIPVIGFGGSHGLAPVPAAFAAFAQSIGPCTAPSCDGETPRLVDAANPNPAFPTFGDVAGGFEVYISEGFAHLDVVTAEPTADNQVIDPLLAFLARNSQRDAAPPCPGDCNGDGEVSINELITALNVALGAAPCSVCPVTCEQDPISINYLIAAVSAALSGCGDGPV